MREALRAQILPLVTRGSADDDEAVLDIKRFETECPLLNSVYMETLRSRNEIVPRRIVMKDTTLTDSRGAEWLLRKGNDAVIPAGIYHLDNQSWGDDVNSFKPERFLAGCKGTAKELARRANACMPFGGGRHLCPGLQFAYAEILSTVATLVLGYEMDQTGPKKFSEVQPKPHVGLDGVAKPMKLGEGVGARLRRNKEWEKTKWNLKC